MTLLFIDGFDQGITTQKPEWDSVQWATAITGRTGSGTAVTAGATVTHTITLPTAAATCVVGMAHNPGTLTTVFGSTAYATPLRFCSAGNVAQLTLTFDASGYLQLRKGTMSGTVLATATAQPFSVSTWRYIEAKALLHLTAGSCVIRVDGVEVINVSGISTSTVTSSVTSVQMATLNSGGGASMAWDDIYICDAVDATATQGRPNSDWLGDVKVVTLFPVAAGSKAEWSPSTAVANFSTVDEPAANTSDYNSSAAASGQQDLYAMGDLPSNTTLVYGIRAAVYASKSDAGTAALKTLVKDPNGTVVTDSTVSLSTTWQSIWGGLRCLKSGGGVYSMADVNAVEVGVESA